MSAWMRFVESVDMKEPVAFIASPGLRSVGKIAIEYLIKKLNPVLLAELYSHSFPVFYHGISYYGTSGDAGVIVKNGIAYLPRIEFYYLNEPEIVLTKGYQADFYGQYEVAHRVIDFYEKMNIRKLVVLAAHGTGGNGIFCAATNKEIVEELLKYGIEVRGSGEFYGFSGLILGMALERNIEGFCLFAETTPEPTNPENPDFDAAYRLVKKVNKIMNIDVEVPELQEEFPEPDYYI
ncbi:MAG TPA: hypothetical protein EYP30_09470 [Archaeoglobaceae archaeon]|nr:hypothetical protein [Archaeoglobaceae archaeon]